MNLQLDSDLLKELEKAGIKHPLVRPNNDRYSNNATFSLYSVSPAFREKLQKHLSRNAESSREHNKLLQKISQFEKVCKSPRTFKAKRLDALEAALTGIVMESGKNRFLWDRDNGLPWLVTGVKYSPAERDSPATVLVGMVATRCGENATRSVVYHQSDITDVPDVVLPKDDDDEEGDVTLIGKPIPQSVQGMLYAKGFIMESPELVEAYEERMARWRVVYKASYEQFLFKTEDFSSDTLDVDDDRWDWDWKQKQKGISQGVFRVVNDVPFFKSRNNAIAEYKAIPSLVRSIDEASTEELDLDEAANFRIPTHPYVYVFNLETHKHSWVLAEQMFEYQYNKHLVEKLILPERFKTLVNILATNTDILSADIVAGKSAGTIIMATGEPGLGKSLTAEATAEAKGSILYKVQSDQLGTEPEKMEERFKVIFARAERWKAVLLIDECDIYVHERGTDIQQNAIVGTILRTFEYFNGLMFLTTNRDVVIDDAVISRCAAVIRYEYPTDEDAHKLFSIFADLFEMALPDNILAEFRKQHPRLSGRSIKNVLRLTARRGVKLATLDDLLLSKEFVPSGQHEKTQTPMTDLQLVELIMQRPGLLDLLRQCTKTKWPLPTSSRTSILGTPTCSSMTRVRSSRLSSTTSIS